MWYTSCSAIYDLEQKHIAMMIETTKSTAVSGGTHFDSTIVYNSSNETATSYS